jgi:hypothetical protein
MALSPNNDCLNGYAQEEMPSAKGWCSGSGIWTTVLLSIVINLDYSRYVTRANNPEKRPTKRFANPFILWKLRV